MSSVTTMDPTTSDNANSKRPVVMVVVTALLAVVFGRAIFSGETFAFRDTANFYEPLFEWEAREWGQGRIPLWNPYDDLGIPVLADATSSVLYPGKILFALPFSFATCFRFYLVGHVVLAAWGAFFAARRWQCSLTASGLCAISYAFGGHVLAQHANVVYLVGAGWLPWAVALADTMLVERKWRHAIGWGVVVTMMILGGDLQDAYHVGLLAGMQAIFLWWRQRRVLHSPSLPTATQAPNWQSWRPVLLLLAAVTAAGLSAVQLLPSWEWARRSERAQSATPRNIYDAMLFAVEKSAIFPADFHAPNEQPPKWSDLGRGILLSGGPMPGTHAEKTYFYSVGPWRWVEFLWPNFYGQMYPIHRRWISLLRAEGGVWSPSLYLGLISVLAASLLPLRRGSLQERWALWMVFIGVLASCGWYGLGWLIHELESLFAPRGMVEAWIGQPVGGLYWLLVVLLPGYGYFRYPAKWFVVASLGMSLLGARGVDQLANHAMSAKRRGGWILVASLVLVAVSWAAKSYLVQKFGTCRANDVFGPIDAEGAWRNLMAALLHTALVAGSWVGVMHVAWLQRIASRPTWLLLLTTLDLCLANRWLVATEMRPGTPVTQTAITRPPQRIAHTSVSWTLENWSSKRDERRFAEVMAWEEEALLRKYHLRHSVAVVDSAPSIQAAETQAFLSMLQDPRVSLDRRQQLLGMVGVEQILVPPAPPTLPVDPTSPDLSASHHDVAKVQRENNPKIVLPRAWIVRRTVTLNRQAEATARTWEQRLHEMLVTRFRDPRQAVFVDAQSSIPKQFGDGTVEDQDECAIELYEPQRIEIETRLRQPALLVVSDLFDPGWTAIVLSPGNSGPTMPPILRVNGLMRGLLLPAGEHRVIMHYRPRSFSIGAAISLASALLISVPLIFFPLLRRSKARRAGR